MESEASLSYSYRLFLFPLGKPRRQNGAGNIVPDAEDGARNCGQRVEVGSGQGCAQSGVLHPRFQRYRLALGQIQAKQLGKTIPQQVSQDVVQNDDCENDEACFHDFSFIEGYYDSDDQDDGDRRY